MEESQGSRRTHRESTVARAVSQSMMYMSMLEREELRMFEELISRFDSLAEAQMSIVGVTPEWSAKDLLAHLAYPKIRLYRCAGTQRDIDAVRNILLSQPELTCPLTVNIQLQAWSIDDLVHINVCRTGDSCNTLT